MTAAEFPGPRSARPVTNPLSLTRLDTAVARLAAAFGIAFALQAISPMLGQIANLRPVWGLVLVGLFAALVFALVASITDGPVRAAHMSFAALYVLALVSWPFAVIEVSRAPTTSFFLYFVLTVATISATIGFGPRLGLLYTIVVPAIYAAVRITPQGGSVSLLLAVLDSVYAIILGGLITIIIVVLRRAATAVDSAQATALSRYSHAVRQHAIDAERVQVDAIVHDSVLTTLISAVRAETQEAKTLAATMASNAIGHLRDAAATGPEVEGEVSAAVVAGRIADAATTMAGHVAVRTHNPGSASLPLHAAEAMYSAAVQAIVNSFQHAGATAARWVEVREDGADALLVEVGDRGAGFDLEDVPVERLGVRVSIIERVASAGGHAEIASRVGGGTVVSLRWPAPGGADPR